MHILNDIVAIKIYHTPSLHVFCSPSLPNNILELGDPELVPKLMPIQPEDNQKKSKYLLPTLSEDTLAEIWKKFVINAPKIQ